jgi:hypothetical protein
MPERYRKTNSYLDAQPRFGPFPAKLLVPVTIFGFGSFWIGIVLLNLPWIPVFVFGASLILTYWLLIANGEHRFLGRFLRPPRWFRHTVYYKPYTLRIMDNEAILKTQVNKKSKKKRAKR